MSQAKVDRYKEQKKNRAKIMAKEKREWFFTKLGLSLIACAMVVWIGFSIYHGVTSKDTTDTTTTAETDSYQVNTSALDDYLNGLYSD